MTRDIIREDARLIILRELYKQNDYQLNDGLLRSTLESFGIGRSREWVRDELKYLEDMNAVKLTTVGSVVVARLLPKGVEHVERRQIIEGVKRPSPVGD